MGASGGTKEKGAVEAASADGKKSKGGKGRSAKCIAWLQVEEIEDGTRYIPQCGDSVVYFRQGHEEYFNLAKGNLEQELNVASMDDDEEEDEEEDAAPDASVWRRWLRAQRDKAPWHVARSSQVRAVEPAKVVRVGYEVLPGGGGRASLAARTACQVALEFADRRSPLCGQRFDVTLVYGEWADFLIERGRFEAAMARNWGKRDRCQAWWQKEEPDTGGEWWQGRVINNEMIRNDRFPDSPWERLRVQYDNSEPLPHSPWELYDVDRSKWWRGPQLDERTAKKALRAIRAVQEAADGPSQGDAFGMALFAEVDKSPAYLARVAQPMSVSLLKARLESGFYRQPEAAAADARLIATNAEGVYGKQSGPAMKAALLADRLLRALQH